MVNLLHSFEERWSEIGLTNTRGNVAGNLQSGKCENCVLRIFLWIYFFVNKIPFLHAKLNKINVRSIQRLHTRKMSEIVKGVKIVQAKYHSRNIKIEKWHVDNEFDCDELRDVILPASMEVYARNEHVGVIEQSTKTVKNRT